MTYTFYMKARPQRLRPCKLSLTGQILFGISALTLWIIAAYIDLDTVGLVITLGFASLALVAGGVIGYMGDKQDMQRFLQARTERPDLFPPYSIFLTLGGFIIGLGLVGLLFIIMDNNWDNTAWVVVEIGSLVGGVALAVLGTKIHFARMRKFSPAGEGDLGVDKPEEM